MEKPKPAGPVLLRPVDRPNPVLAKPSPPRCMRDSPASTPEGYANLGAQTSFEARNFDPPPGDPAEPLLEWQMCEMQTDARASVELDLYITQRVLSFCCFIGKRASIFQDARADDRGHGLLRSLASPWTIRRV